MNLPDLVTKKDNPEVHNQLIQTCMGSGVSPRFSIPTEFSAFGFQWKAFENDGEWCFTKVGPQGTFERLYGGSSMPGGHRAKPIEVKASGGSSMPGVHREEPIEMKDTDLNLTSSTGEGE